MSKFELVLEYPECAFLSAILFNNNPVFVLSDTSEPFIQVEDLENLNNKVSFEKEKLLDFALFLKQNEHFFSMTKKLDLSSFN